MFIGITRRVTGPVTRRVTGPVDAEVRAHWSLARRHADARKGRGAGINPEGRFETIEREAFDDGWTTTERDDLPPLKTQVTIEHAKSIISHNDSPDVGFSQSLNPYVGCEHGCVYCFARPSHAYRNLSPGIDFETRIFAKVNAAELLRSELSKPGYQCEELVVGVNTDAYQPIERELKITRSVLQVCAEFNQPVALITKNATVERDIDVLAPMKGELQLAAFEHETILVAQDRNQHLVPERRVRGLPLDIEEIGVCGGESVLQHIEPPRVVRAQHAHEMRDESHRPTAH